jgi:hypothetical protein
MSIWHLLLRLIIAVVDRCSSLLQVRSQGLLSKHLSPRHCVDLPTKDACVVSATITPSSRRTSSAMAPILLTTRLLTTLIAHHTRVFTAWRCPVAAHIRWYRAFVRRCRHLLSCAWPGLTLRTHCSSSHCHLTTHCRRAAQRISGVVCSVWPGSASAATAGSEASSKRGGLPHHMCIVRALPPSLPVPIRPSTLIATRHEPASNALCHHCFSPSRRHSVAALQLLSRQLTQMNTQ